VSSVPPSELEGESEGGEGDQASSDGGVGWPELEEEDLGDRDKTAKHTVTDVLQALRCGQDLAKLTPPMPLDKELDLWMDFEQLGHARVMLAVKSKDLSLDALLQTHLTGMLGVLNLYLEPTLHYTWREASSVVARMQG